MGTMHGDKIQYAEHFSVGNLSSVFHKIFEDGVVKIVLTFAALGFHWIFDSRREALMVISALIVLDTISGAFKAYKGEKLSSSGFFRFAMKLMVYFILMATTALVDKVMPLPFSSVIMDTFLAATEAISIMENLGAMGYAVPLALIKRLKSIQRGAKEAKDVVKAEDNEPKAG